MREEYNSVLSTFTEADKINRFGRYRYIGRFGRYRHVSIYQISADYIGQADISACLYLKMLLTNLLTLVQAIFFSVKYMTFFVYNVDRKYCATSLFETSVSKSFLQHVFRVSFRLVDAGEESLLLLKRTFHSMQKSPLNWCCRQRKFSFLKCCLLFLYELLVELDAIRSSVLSVDVSAVSWCVTPELTYMQQLEAEKHFCSCKARV